MMTETNKMSDFKIFTAMSQYNTLSAKAKNIVDNFINKNYHKSSISRTDVMKHAIVTLYAQMPNAKSELVAPFKDCIFDLHTHFSQEEIDILLVECNKVIMYCFKYAADIHDSTVHFDDYDNELLEDIVSNDVPLNIYKTPESLIELCERLSGKHGAKDQIYLPYADFSDFPLYYPEANYNIECENIFVNSYAQILLSSQGVKAETVYTDGDFEEGKGHIKTQPDYVFAFNPTLNQTYKSALSYCDGMWLNTQKVAAGGLALRIADCALAAKSGSCLDFILPTGYLDAKWFWYVISIVLMKKDTAKFNATFIKLPSLPYGGTSVSTFLLHIEKDKGNSGMMRFIDASSRDFYNRFRVTEEGRKQLNNLDGEKNDVFRFTNPKYFQREGLNVERIMELYNQEECDAKYEERMHYTEFFNRNEHVPHQYLIDKKLPELSDGMKYIQLKELVVIEPTPFIDEELLKILNNDSLSSNYMDCDIDAYHLKTKNFWQNDYDYDSLSSYYDSIDENCLITGIVSGSLKIGKLTYVESPIAFKKGMVAFKLKSKEVSEDYLLRELVKNYCSMQAMMLANHVIDFRGEEYILEPKDFLEIKIALPSLEEQERLCKEDAHAYLKEADRKLIQSAEEFKRDVHMKKHAIGQTLSNLSNWWDLLQQARKEGNGIVDDSQELGKIHKRAIRDVYDNIQKAMDKLQMQVDRFWRADGLQAQSMSLITFIKEYTKETPSPMFIYNIAALSNNSDSKVVFSPEALRMVFDNIVSNACCHGFENKPSERNIIKIEVGITNATPYIKISNNGKPMHDKLTSEDVFTYGRSSKTGLSHYGIGGYEVRNLMRGFQGDAEFISIPESEFPVCYKLTFKE